MSWKVLLLGAFAFSLSDWEGSWSESRALCSSADQRSRSQAERIAARIVEAPAIAGVSLGGAYELDLRKAVRDDVYYSFSLGGDFFLAKRDGDAVRVFEVFRDGDKMLAIPIYEVKTGRIGATKGVEKE